jgi:hypothetical protein
VDQELRRLLESTDFTKSNLQRNENSVTQWSI